MISNRYHLDMPEKPLYVRLPSEEAARLDAAAAQLRTSKRELVTRLVVEKLDDVLVGHADFRPYPPADVLTAAEVADLLQTNEDTVLELAEAGELPGRKVAGEWRFARDAVLRWLGASA
jgi:excisionase family DNA binding protein